MKKYGVSYEFKTDIILSVEELKKYLMTENKYDRFTLFKTNVLNKAIDEINKGKYIEC